MKLYDNITQVVGNSPLVKINRILDGAKRGGGVSGIPGRNAAQAVLMASLI